MTKTDYTIVFDGGSKGNPGRGYGSYAVSGPAQAEREIRRLTFGSRSTSNEAEYDTLLAALESVLATIRQRGQDPAAATVEVRGDSQLVIFQVTGRWKAHDERMRERRDRVQALAKQFKRAAFVQHPRAASVKILGH